MKIFGWPRGPFPCERVFVSDMLYMYMIWSKGECGFEIGIW